MRSDAQKHSTSELEGSQKAILPNFLIVQMQKVRLKGGGDVPRSFQQEVNLVKDRLMAYCYPGQRSL